MHQSRRPAHHRNDSTCRALRIPSQQPACLNGTLSTMGNSSGILTACLPTLSFSLALSPALPSSFLLIATRFPSKHQALRNGYAFATTNAYCGRKRTSEQEVWPCVFCVFSLLLLYFLLAERSGIGNAERNSNLIMILPLSIRMVIDRALAAHAISAATSGLEETPDSMKSFKSTLPMKNPEGRLPQHCKTMANASALWTSSSWSTFAGPINPCLGRSPHAIRTRQL